MVELQDENGNIHIVDKPFSASESNFRRQLFGLMAACNQFDLLKFYGVSDILDLGGKKRYFLL